MSRAGVARRKTCSQFGQTDSLDLLNLRIMSLGGPYVRRAGLTGTGQTGNGGKAILEKRFGLLMAAPPVFALLVWALSVSAATPTTDVSTIARAVDRHYNHLGSLQAEFIETYRGAGVERVESGTLWLKKPRKMRWEYRSPKEKLFVSDGKMVWFYLPAERQARKTELKKLEDLRSPLAFLLGKTKLETELRGLSRVVDQAPAEAGNTLLRGVPEGIEGRVTEVQLEITPSDQIVRILLSDMDGGTTEFRFAGLKENVSLSDERFKFTPPPGVETVEGELGH